MPHVTRGLCIVATLHMVNINGTMRARIEKITSRGPSAKGKMGFFDERWAISSN